MDCFLFQEGHLYKDHLAVFKKKEGATNEKKVFDENAD